MLLLVVFVGLVVVVGVVGVLCVFVVLRVVVAGGGVLCVVMLCVCLLLVTL